MAAVEADPHPSKTLLQPVQITNPVALALPRTFISCTGEQQLAPIAAAAARVKDAEGWRYRELATGHDAMITVPRELAALLLEVAEG